MDLRPVLYALRIYPIKSCGGIQLPDMDLTPRGLKAGAIGDRRWMLIDEKHEFITQRQQPALARVKVELHDDSKAIKIVADGLKELVITPSPDGPPTTVSIWGKEVPARYTDAGCDAWFSSFLGQKVRLVYQGDTDIRLCDPAFAVEPLVDHVGFADGFPLLVTNLATLKAINEKAGDIPMTRFRPNLVIDHARNHDEYTWQRLRIGPVELALVKPCTRCVVTTIDQDSGIKTGPEPLKTLAQTSFLRQTFGTTHVQGAVFGENAIPLVCGPLSINTPIDILETKPVYSFVQKASV